MNIDVAERLYDNISAERTGHNQCIWLADHTNVFVISSSDRWSCATKACAAGFIFLAEASEGMVFDADSARVFDNLEEANKHITANDQMEFDEPYNPEDLELGITIDRWAADVMELDEDAANDLFFDFGDTVHILDKLRNMIDAAL